MKQGRLLVSVGFTPLALVEERDITYLNPEDLPIDEELRGDLQDWIDDYAELPGIDAPDAYRMRGWVLARRLSRALGPSPAVYWGSALAADAPHP